MKIARIMTLATVTLALALSPSQAQDDQDIVDVAVGAF